jgi:hypothetical protein
MSKKSYKKALMLAEGVKLAEKGHFLKITRDEVAEAVKCSPSLIQIYFGSIDKYRTALIKEAIRINSLPVIAQGIVSGSIPTKALSKNRKSEALGFFL